MVSKQTGFCTQFLSELALVDHGQCSHPYFGIQVVTIQDPKVLVGHICSYARGLDQDILGCIQIPAELTPEDSSLQEYC